MWINPAPASSRTDGDLAGDLGAHYGLPPDPWQQLVLNEWLANDHGRWLTETCCLSAPRQNGKNVAIILRELYGLIGRGEWILHTAHELRSAQKHLQELKVLFGERPNDPHAQYPELNRLVKRMKSLHGQESIDLHTGAHLEIAARSRNAGRGQAFDLLVYDEAQHLDEEAHLAMRPIISASPSPQLIMVGTPPGPLSSGEVFTRRRIDALERKVGKQSWLEWSASEGADLDNRSAWAQANPGLGSHVQLSTVEAERGEFSDEGFARERLGMWAAAATSHVIEPQLWAAQADQMSAAVDHLALAVDIAPDRSRAAVAVAGQRLDGHWHIEVDQQRSGVGWVLGHLVNLCAKNPIRSVVIDSASQARSLTDDLASERITPTITGAAQMATACGQFYDGICEGWLFHPDQPQLSFALSVARRRGLLGGGAWGWNRKSAESDITPLVAATLALWGAQAQHVKRPTRRHSGDRRAVLL